MTAGALLRRAVRRHIGRIGLGLVLLCGHQAAEALVPVAIGVIIDRAVATGDVTAMLVSVAGLAVLFTVIALAYRFGARNGVTAMERETHLLRVEVAGRALDPRGLRDEPKIGELVAIASSDAERAALIIRAVSLGVAALAGLAASSVALLAIDVPLGLGVLVGVPVLVVGLQVLAPALTRRNNERQAAVARTTALATDLVTGLRTLRGVGAQHNAARRYRDSSGQALAATRRAAVTAGVYEGMATAASGLLLAGVAGIAGWFALSGRLTVGELVAVVGLAQFIAEPVQLLGFCGQTAATAWASAGRVATVVAAAPRVEPGGRARPEPTDPRVELCRVSYRTLCEVNLRVARGEILGVAADQRDAVNLITLLSGQIPPTDYTGSVLVDGVPAPELDLDAYRTVVLVEQHDVALFEGTLRSNLSAGAHGDADAGLLAAVRTVAADDLLANRSDPLSLPVTDRGMSLSGGQRQRIGLARALVADPPVLVLHDPTTAVDAVTEQRLADGLAKARSAEPAGTIVITTSPALLARAHRVVILRDGRVRAEGDHTELVAADADYREMVLR